VRAVAQADGDPGELAEPEYGKGYVGLNDMLEEVLLAISPRAGRLLRVRRLLDTRHQEQGR
jgi:hypothetical protein